MLKCSIVKISIVDDEKNLRLAVRTALEKEGFEIEEFSNGQDALTALKSNGNAAPDLYVLDIMMPVMDGIMFLKNYKELYPQIPAIFLTSRDDEFDKVLGLELGADDYLCKPFSIKELIARIKVILRRYSQTSSIAQSGPISQSGSVSQSGPVSQSGIARSQNIDAASTKVAPLNQNAGGLTAGNLFLDTRSYTATLNGNPVMLTVTEFRLLEKFIQNQNAVLTRDALISAAYPDDTYLNDRAIDCHIKRLRKKIGSEKIETLYGLGYKYVG